MGCMCGRFAVTTDPALLAEKIKAIDEATATHADADVDSARVDAERALRIGLVNAVLPNAEATLAHAMSLAREIAAKSPLAIAGSKLALNHARDHGTAASLQHMTLLQSAIFDTDEMAIAIKAWKTKQPAAFEPLPVVTKV